MGSLGCVRSALRTANYNKSLYCYQYSSRIKLLVDRKFREYLVRRAPYIEAKTSRRSLSQTGSYGTLGAWGMDQNDRQNRGIRTKDVLLIIGGSYKARPERNGPSVSSPFLVIVIDL